MRAFSPTERVKVLSSVPNREKLRSGLDATQYTCSMYFNI